MFPRFAREHLFARSKLGSSYPPRSSEPGLVRGDTAASDRTRRIEARLLTGMHIRRRLPWILSLIGAALLILAIVCFYEPIKHEFHYAALIREIQGRNPIQEAEAALNRGDSRFMAIRGIGYSYPEVPDDRKLVEKHGVIPIEGTSDCLIGETQTKFQYLAWQFASQYNREILARLQHPPLEKADAPKER